MKRKWILILLVIILICLFIWWFNTFTIKTTVTEIVSDKIKNEIKIVQISDLHGSTFGKDNNKLIRKIRIFVMKLTTFVVWHKYKELFLKGDYEYKKFKKHSIEYPVKNSI